jgi:hypothetical protein
MCRMSAIFLYISIQNKTFAAQDKLQILGT